MRNNKYFFNPVTLAYEQIRHSFRKKLSKAATYALVALAYAVLVLFIAFNFYDSPKEKMLKREISQMKFQYEVLNDKLDELVTVMDDIQDRDDNIYRVIFEAEPIPSTTRKAGYGGTNRYSELDGYDNSKILIETTKKVDQITSQLVVQSKSFDEVYRMAKNKAQFLASMPAIQPVNNKDMKKLTSYYGYRMDPFYKVMKFHEGVDFSAPVGTEIYATGDGEVVSLNSGKREYGNSVLIDHGFGFKTFYAHCHKIMVKPGQKVKRGQVIATIGNTGKSTGPHLHYEVHKGGRPINPINYFFSDITPGEYEMMLELSARPSQTLD